jgi:hypothetical protein
MRRVLVLRTLYFDVGKFETHIYGSTKLDVRVLSTKYKVQKTLTSAASLARATSAFAPVPNDIRPGFGLHE